MSEGAKAAFVQDSPGSLPRILGFWDIVGIAVGCVIGSGIFIVPAAVAANMQYPLLILAVWAGSGILCFFGAVTFAELGAAYPQAGGMYVYLREAYSPLIAFLFGWTLFLVIDSGSIATLAVAFSSIPMWILIRWSRRPRGSYAICPPTSPLSAPPRSKTSARKCLRRIV